MTSPPSIRLLQAALLAAGFDPKGEDGVYGPDTQAAVRAFQQAKHLPVTGLADDATIGGLKLYQSENRRDITAGVTTLMVADMFPETPVANIGRNLPYVLGALSKAGIGDRDLVLAALATIRAETESFEPIKEGISRFNTRVDPFDLYNDRHDLGNGPSDGARFPGRGYVQLTGRANYTFYGAAIGRPLASNPDLACDPTVAGELLAAFLQRNETPMRAAIARGDLAEVRRLVNGGSNGLDRFEDAWRRGLIAIPA